MKWPTEINFIRHGRSAYNEMGEAKSKDPLYQDFLRAFGKDLRSEETQVLARLIRNRYQLGSGDYDTPLTETGRIQSHTVGQALKDKLDLPETIFLSPHLRASQTLSSLIAGWPALISVPAVSEPRLREQEHGLALVFNDKRVFQAFYPDQKLLHDLEGPYWYRFPQGENVPDGIERIRSFIGTLVRDYSEKKILVISHHLTILFFLAAILRWSCEEFIRTDKECKPINCGLTTFRGNPEVGDDGRLELISYNVKLY